MKRRTFLHRTATSAAVVSAGGLWTAEAQTPKRSSADPTNSNPPGLQKYMKAVEAMKKLPSSDGRSWTAQANIHNNFCPHENWWFLPWHRAYLFYFEQVCRDVLKDNTFALPYWDWTKNPKLPAAFLVNSSPLFIAGRNSSINIGIGVTGTSVINTILKSSSLTLLFSGSTTTDSQRASSTTGQFEGTPHNGVHNAVGGQMLTFMSPLDPIFWLHHCNIDRIWASWAALHGNAVPSQALWANHKLTQFFDPKTKKQVTAPTSDMKNAAKYNAVYDELAKVTTGRPVLTSRLGGFVLGRETALPPALQSRVITEEASATSAPTAGTSSWSVKPAQRLNNALTKSMGASGDSGPDTFLELRDVPRPSNPSTIVRVFLNTKNAGPTTSVDSPGFAGTVSWFGDASHPEHGGGQRTFLLDVRDVLKKLSLNANSPIEVALVPVTPTGEAAGASQKAQPGKVRLVAVE